MQIFNCAGHKLRMRGRTARRGCVHRKIWLERNDAAPVADPCRHTRRPQKLICHGGIVCAVQDQNFILFHLIPSLSVSVFVPHQYTEIRGVWKVQTKPAAKS